MRGAQHRVPGEHTFIAGVQVLDHEDRHREIRGKRRKNRAQRLDAAGRVAHHNGLVIALCMSRFVRSHGQSFFW